MLLWLALIKCAKIQTHYKAINLIAQMDWIHQLKIQSGNGVGGKIKMI